MSGLGNVQRRGEVTREIVSGIVRKELSGENVLHSIYHTKQDFINQ